METIKILRQGTGAGQCTEQPGKGPTPAAKMFSAAKARYRDRILFFRYDDFCEVFFDDAKVCSEVCGLALITRVKGDEKIPVASMPYCVISGYLKKMLQAGHKLAVIEQGFVRVLNPPGRPELKGDSER